jgi:hypothetical protein
MRICVTSFIGAGGRNKHRDLEHWQQPATDLARLQRKVSQIPPEFAFGLFDVPISQDKMVIGVAASELQRKPCMTQERVHG